MRKNKILLLEEELQDELKNLERLEREISEILSRLEKEPSFVEIRAIGSIIHDFYCGVEKIFERIARVIDGKVPGGEDWHTQLLNRIGAPLHQIRPPIITEKMREKLKEYLRFRHLFRNIYGFELKWEILSPLAKSMPSIQKEFAQSITKFFGFMEEVRQWHYKQCKGWIESYVSREKEELKKVSKTLSTYLDRGWVSNEELEKIFKDVERDSVEAFKGKDFYLERKQRLENLRKTLDIKPV